MEPPTDPEVAERRSKAVSAARLARAGQTAAQKAAEVHQKAHAEVVAQLEQAESAERQRITAYRTATATYKRYHDAIAEGQVLVDQCKKKQASERAAEIHAYLAEFTPSLERDTVIVGLEACRKLLRKDKEASIRANAGDLRTAFAIGIEEDFDDNNPYYKGRLVATVKGDTLAVSMRGNFEGRRRHSQEQVDEWCEASALFSKISLRNSHGTFTCVPDETLKDVTMVLLQEAGILDSWDPPRPGSTPPPVSPAPPPPPDGPEKVQLNARVAAAKAQLDTEVARESAEKDRLQQATEVVQTIDAREQMRHQAWQEDEVAAAKVTQTAGIVTGGVGAVSIAVGAYVGHERSSTNAQLEAEREQAQAFGGVADTQDLETKRSRQTTGMILGLSVGIPLLLTGVVLFVVGKRRQNTVKNMTLTPGGLQLRF